MEKKLGFSILCAGAMLLGYLSLSYAIILLVVVVLLKADKKLIRAAASSVSFYGLIYLIEKLISYFSGWFSKMCNLFLSWKWDEVYAVVSKLNIFSYAASILSFLVFVYTAFLFFSMLTGKDVKVLFVNNIVNKCLGEEEKAESKEASEQ